MKETKIHRATKRQMASPNAGRCWGSRRTGFTLIELLVVIAIIAVLAGMLLPALSRSKGAGRSVRCTNNLSQLGMGLMMYQQDFDAYPLMLNWAAYIGPRSEVRWWVDYLEPYLGNGGWTNAIYRCPDYPGYTFRLRVNDQRWNAPVGSYGYNAAGNAGGMNKPLGLGGEDDFIPTKASAVLVPAEMIAIGDAHLGKGFHSDDPAAGKPAKPNGHFYLGGHIGLAQLSNKDIRQRHKGSFNVLFCDTHVPSIKAERLFAKTDSALRRWNNDHEPHRELVP